MCLLAIQAVGQTPGDYPFDGAGGNLNVPVAGGLECNSLSCINVDSIGISDFGSSDTRLIPPVRDNSAYASQLTALSFDVQRSVDLGIPHQRDGNASAPMGITEGVSLTLESHGLAPDENLDNHFLNFLNFKNLAGETVMVRFYRWKSDRGNGWLDFDSVALGETVSLVPEPSTLIPLGAGCFLFLRRYIRRRR